MVVRGQLALALTQPKPVESAIQSSSQGEQDMSQSFTTRSTIGRYSCPCFHGIPGEAQTNMVGFRRRKPYLGGALGNSEGR